MRKAIASILSAWWTFIQAHRFLGLLTTLAFAAACAGALYLIIAQLPTLMAMPCLHGGGCQ